MEIINGEAKKAAQAETLSQNGEVAAQMIDEAPQRVKTELDDILTVPKRRAGTKASSLSKDSKIKRKLPKISQRSFSIKNIISAERRASITRN